VNVSTGPTGGAYGGGGGGGSGACGRASACRVGGAGSKGAVRIIWPGCSRLFPSTNTGSP
jgi:hypothetical protein